jgi:tRNA pseudouridine55 synthase
MPYDGWLVLYKPIGPSSFDMVKEVRRLFPRKTKIGHGGTLDPLAEGILPIAVGEATKTVDYLMNEKKEYLFDVCWGEQRETDDLEGGVLYSSANRPTQKDIEAILPQFIGALDQLPPLYSAKKIDGKRACDLMRQGKEVVLKPSAITVFTLEILTHTPDKTLFKALCSKGTYIRSLARDMGQALDCYGYAASIKRSQVGAMSLENALSLEKLAVLEKDGILGEMIRPIQAVLADIPAVLVTPDQEQKLRYGQAVVYPQHALIPEGQLCALCINDQNEAVAIVDVDGRSFRPKRVFNIK